MRSGCGAIVVGRGTVEEDDPQLTVRGDAALGMSVPPIRVVLDRELRVDPTMSLFSSVNEAPVVIACVEGISIAQQSSLEARRAHFEALGVQVWDFPANDYLEGVLRLLQESNVTDVLLESGPELARSFQEAGLLDTITLFEADLEAPDGETGFVVDHPVIVRAYAVEPTAIGSDSIRIAH
jgi:diaminohydroxyphosphoribosylaminopyrimidine deaminase/5-amino-6-(5-phosphoribosylamino)uracil reductase